ncbi:MAG: hypothetical protein U0T78_05420 [Cloacibacterium normanense]
MLILCFDEFFVDLLFSGRNCQFSVDKHFHCRGYVGSEYLFSKSKKSVKGLLKYLRYFKKPSTVNFVSPVSILRYAAGVMCKS